MSTTAPTDARLIAPTPPDTQGHTAGPWEWCYRVNENDENDGSVFWMKREGHAYCVAKAPRYQTEEQWAADAALIAAAPETAEERDRLKKHLQEILTAYETGALEMNSPEIDVGDPEIPPHPWHKEWMHITRAALKGDE